MAEARERGVEIDQIAWMDVQTRQQRFDGAHGLRASAYRNQQ
jgi:hypothetical protein